MDIHNKKLHRKDYRYQPSQHPGWVSAWDVANHAWHQSVVAGLYGYPFDVLNAYKAYQIQGNQFKSNSYKAYRNQFKLTSLMRARLNSVMLNPGKVSTRAGLFFGAVSLLDGISRNAMYLLRGKKWSAMDDIAISGFNAIAVMLGGFWLFSTPPCLILTFLVSLYRGCSEAFHSTEARIAGKVEYGKFQ